jgi:hypothetical protein
VNITFEQQYPATGGHGASIAVRCDQLPVRNECRIVEQPRVPGPGVWFLCTAASNPYAGRRRRGPFRKYREFESLDAAKAAAVAYVTARVAEAKRQEPVRHGRGQYCQFGRRWYVAFDNGNSWQPAGSKKAAIALLDNPPAWAFADCKS